MAEVRASIHIRVAAGESEQTRFAFRELLLAIPDAPGLGFTMDEAVLMRYATRP